MRSEVCYLRGRLLASCSSSAGSVFLLLTLLASVAAASASVVDSSGDEVATSCLAGGCTGKQREQEEEAPMMGSSLLAVMSRKQLAGLVSEHTQPEALAPVTSVLAELQAMRTAADGNQSLHLRADPVFVISPSGPLNLVRTIGAGLTVLSLGAFFLFLIYPRHSLEKQLNDVEDSGEDSNRAMELKVSSPPEATHDPEQTAQLKAFCPDCVVPSVCDCLLYVPVGPLGQNPVKITDQFGQVVLQVAPMAPLLNRRGAPKAEQPFKSEEAEATKCTNRPKRFMLMSSQDEVLAQFGQIKPAAGNGKECAPEFQFFREGGDYFAKLICGEDHEGYVVTTIHGDRLHYWGYFEKPSVSVTDDAGGFQAAAEPCEVDFDPSREYYCLRAAPLSDAGLVLCGLLCLLEHLGFDRQRRGE